MRFLGAHRYRPGDAIGRWTVVRHLSPVQRMHGRDKIIHQHRVLVRCVCGEVRSVREVVLSKGKSSGCPSRTCGHIHRIRRDVAVLEATRQRALAEAQEAEMRILAANTKVCDLWRELQSRRPSGSDPRQVPW